MGRLTNYSTYHLEHQRDKPGELELAQIMPRRRNAEDGSDQDNPPTNGRIIHGHVLPAGGGGGGGIRGAGSARPRRSVSEDHLPALIRPTADSLIFAQDTDFEPSPWNSDTMSERTPLFGEASEERKSSSPPKDNYRVVWLVFYLLGMATLLPWNFFIAVNDYWNFKFRDPSGNSTHTQLQKEFTSYLAIASNVPNAVFVILNVFYGRNFPLNTRIIGSLSLMSTLFIGVTIMSKINSDLWQEWFLYSTLTIVVLLNICTAVYQGGLMGVAGKFPAQYIGGLMAGQALGGIFPAVVNIVVIAVQVSPGNIGFYCFLVALIFILLSLVVYCAVQTTSFFQYYSANNTARVDPSTVLSSSRISYRGIATRSWKYLTSIFLNFTVTLTVFPSVIVLISSQFSGDPDNIFATVYFTPVTCFLLFNCGDYLGRILASSIGFPNSSPLGQNLVLLVSILRIGFIPLFLFCNAAPDVRNFPVYFDKDSDYYALMVMFSISNGYIGNLCMMHGPKTVEEGEEQEAVASVLVAILVLGIGFGSALSYPLVNLL